MFFFCFNYLILVQNQFHQGELLQSNNIVQYNLNSYQPQQNVPSNSHNQQQFHAIQQNIHSHLQTVQGSNINQQQNYYQNFNTVNVSQIENIHQGTSSSQVWTRSQNIQDEKNFVSSPGPPTSSQSQIIQGQQYQQQQNKNLIGNNSVVYNNQQIQHQLHNQTHIVNQDILGTVYQQSQQQHMIQKPQNSSELIQQQNLHVQQSQNYQQPSVITQTPSIQPNSQINTQLNRDLHHINSSGNQVSTIVSCPPNSTSQPIAQTVSNRIQPTHLNNNKYEI